MAAAQKEGPMHGWLGTKSSVIALLSTLLLGSPSSEQAFSPIYSQVPTLLPELTSCIRRDLRKFPLVKQCKGTCGWNGHVYPMTWRQKGCALSQLTMLLLSTLCTIQNMQILLRRIGCKVKLFWMSNLSIFARSIFPHLVGYSCQMAKKNKCWRWKRLHSMTRTANFGL